MDLFYAGDELLAAKFLVDRMLRDCCDNPCAASTGRFQAKLFGLGAEKTEKSICKTFAGSPPPPAQTPGDTRGPWLRLAKAGPARDLLREEQCNDVTMHSYTVNIHIKNIV